jgi:glycosyltransferase involved in cell wall biosynthesis
MRILQLVTKRQRRGAEVFASQLADGLTRRGHEVIFVGLFPSSRESLATEVTKVRDLHGRPDYPLSLRLIPELRTLIRRERPDLVQANGSATLKHVGLAKRIFGGDWRLVYRNIGIASDWLHYPGHRFWGRWLLGSVDHVAAVSRHSLSDFRQTYGVPASKISTIPIGVRIPDASEREAARTSLVSLAGLHSSDEIIAHVGSFTPEKNHLWLLEAFSEIAAHRPAAHLVLIGDGPMRGRVEADIHRRDLGARVHLLKSRDDAATLVGGADLLVLPSVTEGIPGALLEAAAQGVPVVATDVGSIREAVEDGRTGLLVPPGALDMFVGAITDMLNAPSWRRELGEEGRRFVRQRYDIDRVVDRFEALYLALCSGKLAPREEMGVAAVDTRLNEVDRAVAGVPGRPGMP